MNKKEANPVNKIRDLLKLEESVPWKDEDGNIYWWLPSGGLHRKYGPAVEYADESKEWWKSERRHREDGPAIEWANGEKTHWFINGTEVTEQEYPEKLKEFLNSKDSSKPKPRKDI